MTPDEKPLGPLRSRLLLGLASLTVIGVGLAVAPEPSERTERPREAPAPILQRELAIERAHEQITTSVQRAAADARQYVVSVDRRGLGLAVDTAEVLTVAGAIEDSRRVRLRTPDGQPVDGEVSLYDPDTELVVVRLRGGPGLTPVPSALAEAAPGALVFATGATASGLVIAPAFVTSVTPDEHGVGGLGGGVPPGAPLFTMDGRSAGILNRPSHAIRLHAALERLRERRAAGPAIPGGTGIVLQSSRELGTRFGSEGAVIADVLPDSPASGADLRAGDVIVAMDGSPVASFEEASARLSALGADLDVRLEVTRGRLRPTVVTVQAASLLGARWREAQPLRDVGAPAASEIFSPATLRAAGLTGSARVLTVDGRRVTTRLADSRRPRLAHISIDGRRRFALIPGAGA